MDFRSVSRERLFLVFLIALLGASARAGQYVTTYIQKGNVVSVEGGTTTTRPYDTYTTAPPEGVLKAWGWDQNQGSIHCSGATQAKLVWTPDPNLPAGAPPDLPPKCVVLMERATAHSNYPAAGSGSVTTGFAGERHEVGYSGGAWYLNAYFWRYRVIYDPGSEILLDPCNADAAASYGTSNDPYNEANALVAYNACATPLVVTTGGAGYLNGSGVYVSRGENLLIGQRLTATVATPIDYSLDKASTGSDPTCQWSVSGTADPFKRFVHTNDVLYSVGRRDNLTAPDLTGKQLLCCFARSGTGAIALTAHIAVPSGALPASGLDVSYATDVQVQAPKMTEVDPGSRFGLLSVTLGKVVCRVYGSDWSMSLTDLNEINGTAPSGIVYRGGIATPPSFVRGSDMGGWVWVQLLRTSTRRSCWVSSATNAIDQALKCVSDLNPSDPPWTFGIDGGFSYAPTAARDIINEDGANDTVSSGEGFQMYIADGRVGRGRDTPNEPLTTTDSDSPLDGNGIKIPAKIYNIKDDFTVWQMYKAPGADSQFVPIQSFHWWWGGLTSYNGTGWVYNSSASDHGFDSAVRAFSKELTWPAYDRFMNASRLHYVGSN